MLSCSWQANSRQNSPAGICQSPAWALSRGWTRKGWTEGAFISSDCRAGDIKERAVLRLPQFGGELDEGFKDHRPLRVCRHARLSLNHKRARWEGKTVWKSWKFKAQRNWMRFFSHKARTSYTWKRLTPPSHSGLPSSFSSRWCKMTGERSEGHP